MAVIRERLLMIPPLWRTVALAVGAVGAAALLAAGVWLWSAAREQRGTAAYAEVLLRASQAQGPKVSAEERLSAMLDLERVLTEHPSNAMAAQAAYTLGDLRFTAKEYDKARAAWQITLGRTKEPTLSTLARAGIGYAWEAQGKLAEAGEAYETALAGVKPVGFYYEELLFDIARVQESSGKKDLAIVTYRRILKEIPRTARGDEVRSRLAYLGSTP